MTIRFAASIVLGLVATTSAYAAEPAAPAPAKEAAAVSRQSTTEQRYCVRYERPNSRIRGKECGNRQDLTALGFNMDAALAGR